MPSSPRTAVFTVGYRNRFGHPRADVVARYADRDVQILRTDRTGALTVTLDAQGLGVAAFRQSAARYWRTEASRPAPVTTRAPEKSSGAVTAATGSRRD